MTCVLKLFENSPKTIGATFWVHKVFFSTDPSL